MKNRFLFTIVACLVAFGSFGFAAAQHNHHHADTTPEAGHDGMGTPMAMDMNTSTGAFYLTITNHGDEPDSLVSVTSDAAELIEIHNVIMTNGAMSMEAQPDGVEIPAHGELVLEPGGYHVMMIGLTRSLLEGETFTATLHFANAGDVEITVPIYALEPESDELAEPVAVGDHIEVSNVWARQAPKLEGPATPVATPEN